MRGSIFNRLSAREFLSETGRISRDQPDNTRLDERVEMVMRFKHEAEECALRKKALGWWRESDRLLSGNHWDLDDDEEGDYHNRHVVNLIYPMREKLASLMIERLGQTQVLSRNAYEQAVAENIDNYLLHEFENNNWLFPLAVACKKAIDHGVAWIKAYWDFHGDGGIGTMRLEPVSNYDFLWHDGAMIKEGEMVTKYALHCFEKTRSEILSIYDKDPEGEYEEMMGSGGWNRDGPEVNGRLSGLQRANELGIGKSRPIGAFGSGMESQDPNDSARKDTYEVIECWYQDDTRVEGPEFEFMETGGVPPLKYPHGRVITVCNGRVMFDEPNPLGYFPFIPLCVSADPESLFLPSDINQCAGPQMELNKRRSQVTDHTELCSNPKMVVSRFSQIQQETPTNDPGTVIISNDSEGRDMGVKWLVPPPLGREVFELIAMCKQDIDEISGVHEVNRGDVPAQARSGVAIERLQMEGMTRTNMRSLFFDQGIKTLYRCIISSYLDNVSEERQFRFTDPTTLADEYGTFDPQAMVLPKRELRIEELQDQIVEFEYQLEFMELNQLPELEDVGPYLMAEIQRLNREIQAVWEMPTHELISFDIRIATGMRNLSKSSQASLAMELKQMDVITDEDLLKVLDFPGWMAMIRKKQEQTAAMIEAEEQAIDDQLEDQIEIMEDEQDHELEMQERDHKNQRELQKMKIMEATKKADAQRKAQKSAQKKKGA